MPTGLTGAPVHKGAWLGLPDFGITEFLQGGTNTATPSGAPTPTPVPTPTPSSNNTSTSGVPYGPYLNQPLYSPSTLNTNLQQNLNTYRQNNPSPTQQRVQQVQQQNSNDPFSGFSMDYYPGWGEREARADWLATGGAKGRQGSVSTVTPDEIKRREDAIIGNIETGYNEYMNRLGGIQGMYETSQNDSIGSTNRVYDQLFGGLTDQKQANLDKLAAGKTEVQARQASSIKDLQQNLSNVLRGASMQFGAMGAGDTSATRTMLPYAYTKLAGAQEGAIRNQSNDQLFQIEQEGRDTEAKFTDLWRQTEVDKESAIQGIKEYYGSAIQNIQLAMANAPLAKADALAKFNQSLFEEAKNRLFQLEDEDRQKKENLRTWATGRISELNNLKLQLSGSANFKPQDIVWNELSLQGATPGTSGQGMDFSNYVTATRKKYLGQ